MKRKGKLILIVLFLVVLEIMQIPVGSKDLVVLDTEVALAEENENISKFEVESAQSKYDSNNIVGILKIPNTDYQTVVVQGKDNSFYLNRDASGKKNKGGTPFLDYRVNIDSSKKLLIYGHNSRYSEMPFKVLENYYDESYYKNHKYLVLSTEDKKIFYQIFSVYVETENWSYTNIKFKDNNDWLKHLETLKNNSMYDTGVSIDKKDEILILQTCSTKKEYRNYKKKFLLVIAKKVEM